MAAEIDNTGRIQAEAERSQAEVGRGQADVGRGQVDAGRGQADVGHGQALDGLVRVVVRRDGRIRSLVLDPRLHRLRNDEVADAIIRAVNAALEDATSRAQDEWLAGAFTEALNHLGRPAA